MVKEMGIQNLNPKTKAIIFTKHQLRKPPTRILNMLKSLNSLV